MTPTPTPEFILARIVLRGGAVHHATSAPGEGEGGGGWR